jgi:uncharacterized protein (DUF1499 family)
MRTCVRSIVIIGRTATRSGSSSLAASAVLIAIAGGITLALAGPGYRMGWWELDFGLLTIQRYAGYAGLAGAALGSIALIARRGIVLPGLAILIGIVTFGIPWEWQRTVDSVPRIHDVSTDTDTPPQFQAIVAVRQATNANALDYSAQVIEQQKQSYPDIAPVALPVPAPQAFDRALELARSRGWEIVSADASAGRIEATATSRWFGFKDDVVIRVTPTADGSRIDLRSVSRVGQSDVGANAQRIRAFAADLLR